MRRRRRQVRWKNIALGLALGLGWGLAAARSASAQYGGMPGQPGGMPQAPAGQEPKEEGPAEAAPEEEGRPSDLEPLTGYAEQNKKRMQIFEIDGYLRMRGDYLHNFFLGQGYTSLTQPVPPSTNGSTTVSPGPGLPPFPVPLGCRPPDSGGGLNPCGTKGLGAANLRLRLEPTLNVTDQVRVHAQFDVLDNTIMGSTPDSLVGINRTAQDGVGGAAPAPLLYETQDAPEISQNGYLSSVRAKRAWGEVDSEFGSLRFGRMPWHFGRGIAYNDGSCPDCDHGTNVDRLMALTQLYGHQIAASWDFGAQGLTSQQLNLGRNDPGGYPIDLSQDDDVVQFMAAITRIDTPIHLRERVDRGDLVVNYGLQLVYRSQQATAIASTTSAPTGTTATTREQAADSLTNVGAHMVMPDLWLKLYFRALTIEFEGSGVFGKIDHSGPLGANGQDLAMRQFGWVLASELRLYRDAFFLGFETGGATGDAAGNSDAAGSSKDARSQYLNYRWRFVQQPMNDHALDDFKFSPEYHIDEILFRHILGTVTNAVYFKPQIAYWFDLQQTRQLGLNGAVIYSMAPVRDGTPGHGLSYGIEMNVGVNYRNSAEGFYAGLTWGVLWPLAALDRPATHSDGTAFWGPDAANASAAQVLRTFFGIRF
ncbi:MAG TPA: TIGR04551 family protein [Polyangia bacterium]|jgi:uncharacterized protein (TIGR04551 family)|nr:TIGR04551 family protein [Polyangia bacterium]